MWSFIHECIQVGICLFVLFPKHVLSAYYLSDIVLGAGTICLEDRMSLLSFSLLFFLPLPPPYTNRDLFKQIILFYLFQFQCESK